mmetsp:Transcript_115907/g.249050  ORF Transcript_115907/g.249050 Transcript_115907/m.249050 type:complete len:479 (-) Transcript_115907:255-1691(-)
MPIAAHPMGDAECLPAFHRKTSGGDAECLAPFRRQTSGCDAECLPVFHASPRRENRFRLDRQCPRRYPFPVARPVPNRSGRLIKVAQRLLLDKKNGSSRSFLGDLQASPLGSPARSGRTAPSWVSQAARILLLVGLWWTAAAVVIIMLKRILSAPSTGRGAVAMFPFPFALAGMTNAAASFMQLLSVKASELQAFEAGSRQRKRPEAEEMTWKETAVLVAIGAIHGASVGCTNMALGYLMVSERAMLVSLHVLFMMTTARLYGVERLGRTRLAAVALLTLGGVLQGLGKADGTDIGLASVTSTRYLYGAGLQMLSMLLSSNEWILMQYVMQRSPRNSALGRSSKLQLSARIRPVTTCVCLFFAVLFEADAFSPRYLMDPELLMRVLTIGVGLSVLSVSEMSLVHITSAVALQVLSTLQQVVFLVISVAFLGEKVSALSAFGFGVCVVGAMVYMSARRADAATEQHELPAEPCSQREHP